MEFYVPASQMPAVGRYTDMTQTEIFSEARNWILLALAFVGALITIRTFIENTKQRKLDNTYKTLDYLRKHITDRQIETFKKLFEANNPLTGVKENEFRFKKGEINYVEDMFAEGGCGNGDIENMITVFNLISKTLNKELLEDSLIWYEYGQIMTKCYSWTSYLKTKSQNFEWPGDFFDEFNKYMANTYTTNWPIKIYIHLE